MRTSSRGQGLTGPTPPALGHMETLPFAFGHRVSEYHLFTEGIDRSTPAGVVVRLHVDGDKEFRHPDGLLTSLAQVTAERNMILATPLTPHRTRGCTWWRKLEKNIAWLDVIRSCDHYNVPQPQLPASFLDTHRQSELSSPDSVFARISRARSTSRAIFDSRFSEAEESRTRSCRFSSAGRPARSCRIRTTSLSMSAPKTSDALTRKSHSMSTTTPASAP